MKIKELIAITVAGVMLTGCGSTTETTADTQEQTGETVAVTQEVETTAPAETDDAEDVTIYAIPDAE